MSRRRCFFYCDGKPTLYALPKADDVKNQWLQFMFNKIPATHNQNLYLCPRHFSHDCFVNRTDFDAGLVQRLILKDRAVPSLGVDGASVSSPGTSQQEIHYTPLYPTGKRRHNVQCQTDRLPVMSVGTQYANQTQFKKVATQLSMGTLRGHVRSKGVQVSVSSVCASTETNTEYEDDVFRVQPKISPTTVEAPVSSVSISTETTSEYGDELFGLQPPISPTTVEAPVSSVNVSTETTSEYGDELFGLQPPISPTTVEAPVSSVGVSTETTFKCEDVPFEIQPPLSPARKRPCLEKVNKTLN